MDAPFIEVKGLAKRFGGRQVLRDVNFTLSAKECVVILGPNGAGKSTLLKIIAALMMPDSGEVRWKDSKDGDVRRLVGFLSHDSWCYPALTAEENLTFYGRLFGLKEVEKKVSNLLEEVGLSYAAEEPLRGFSRGMEQRLALARALMHDPKVLLLDEPYTAMDHQGTSVATALFQKVFEAGGAGILVTHDFHRAAELGHRFLVLQKGRMVGTDLKPPVTAAELHEFFVRTTESEARA